VAGIGGDGGIPSLSKPQIAACRNAFVAIRERFGDMPSGRDRTSRRAAPFGPRAATMARL